MEKKTEVRVSFGFAEALTILFIALKLTNVINWSWIAVLSPVWISAVAFGIMAIIVLIKSKRK